jgi:hypothetical protein
LKLANRVGKRLSKEGIEFQAKPLYAWTTSLCRLILRIQNYRHGGALLITPDRELSGLKVRHALSYTRFRTAIEDKVFFEELYHRAWKEARKRWQSDLPIPTDVHLDEVVCKDDLKDARLELDGAIWFISLLSRVDGLVLLTPEFDIRGFGVEITASEIPSRVFTAGNPAGSMNALKVLEYERFGTRHRSMMRYCAAVPGSIGVVISQDGDVRVMTSGEAGVVVWENVKLQLDTRARRRGNKLARARVPRQ